MSVRVYQCGVCGDLFSAFDANIASISTTVDGVRVHVDFCSYEHLAEWVVSEQNRRRAHA